MAKLVNKLMTLTVGLSFLVPQIPSPLYAQNASTVSTADLLKEIPADLFPVDTITKKDDKDKEKDKDTKDSGTKEVKKADVATPVSGGARAMGIAKVPEAYACPTFENPSYAELLSAIDSLTKELKSASECTNNASATAADTNAKSIRDSVSVLQKAMVTQDPTAINVADIEKNVTTSIQAIQNLTSILSSNSFLNSSCGRQTMSTPRAFMALNDIVSGIGPYALLAISMKAALAPALGIVVGSIIATSTISAVASMYDAGVDMKLPENRKATIQNTCQYVKVAKKIRFMQLAQSGKIDKITEELERNIKSYSLQFSQPAPELYPLLKIRDSSNKVLGALAKDYEKNRQEFLNIDQQMSQNPDDLMMCTLSRELANWANDTKAFPTSVVVGLEQSANAIQSNNKLQVEAMKRMHSASIKRVIEFADKMATDENAVKACASAGRSWMMGLRQSLNLNSQLITNEYKRIDTELSKNESYQTWKAQYERIRIEKVTASRVQIAMTELAKDQSIIDRSEFAQRIATLKAGLFGTDSWKFGGKPPVLKWLEHMKSMHDVSISAFAKGWDSLYSGGWSISRSEQQNKLQQGGKLETTTILENTNRMNKEIQGLEALKNLNLTTLPLRSRTHVLACQQLESTWLDWSAAIDHLGATQYFCAMIDEVLDVKMDPAIVRFCRGKPQLNGDLDALSTPQEAQKTLEQTGFSKKALIVSKKLKELQCPMPDMSVLQ